MQHQRQTTIPTYGGTQTLISTDDRTLSIWIVRGELSEAAVSGTKGTARTIFDSECALSAMVQGF